MSARRRDWREASFASIENWKELSVIFGIVNPPPTACDDSPARRARLEDSAGRSASTLGKNELRDAGADSPFAKGIVLSSDTEFKSFALTGASF